MPKRLLLLCFLVAIAGCDPLSITAAGVGGSAAISHTLGGITYRTFTLPSATVRNASLVALHKMGIKVGGTAKGDNGAETVKATAIDRDIEITFEPLSASSTRMKVVARNGRIFTDSATATEIIVQTERQLNGKA